jgi:hypothetical protein
MKKELEVTNLWKGGASWLQENPRLKGPAKTPVVEKWNTISERTKIIRLWKLL